MLCTLNHWSPVWLFCEELFPSCPSIEQETRRSFKLQTDQFMCMCFWYNFCRKEDGKKNHPNTMGDSNTQKKNMFSRLGWYLKKTLLQQILDTASQASGKPCASAVSTSTPAASKAETKPCHSLVEWRIWVVIQGPERKDWDETTTILWQIWWWFRTSRWRSCMIWTNCQNGFFCVRDMFCHYTWCLMFVGFLQLQLL